MSKRLIYEEDAIDALNALFKKQVTQFGYEGYEKADEKTQLVCDGISYSIGCVLNLPSAQPERKKGRWIYGEHDIAMCDGYMCDKCGFFVPWDYKYTFIDFINDYHFCPNCGSDMRGEQDG